MKANALPTLTLFTASSFIPSTLHPLSLLLFTLHPFTLHLPSKAFHASNQAHTKAVGLTTIAENSTHVFSQLALEPQSRRRTFGDPQQAC